MIESIITKFIFGQKHNGIECALYPTAKRSCDRAWFTEAQIEKWSRMSMETLWGCLNKLEKVSRICSLTDSIECDIPTNDGDFQVAQLYNLNVLNQLAMVCIDNEKLNDISCKFYDIMSEVGTTGSYSIRKPESYMIDDPIKRAKRWIEETEELQKALSAEETAHAETKALLAEEREKVEMLSEAVDNAVRTIARINDKIDATALGTAGTESKECEIPWMRVRDWCNKHGLPTNTNEPKWKVLERLYSICESYPEREQWHTNASGAPVFPKWACDILDKMYDDDDTFLSEYRTE